MAHIKTMALALAVLTASQAHAASYSANFSGSGVSGSVTLTYEINPRAGGAVGTSPNLFDPVGSYIVTGATGSFIDQSLGLTTSITGTVASNPADPDATNLLAPASFGHYIISNGVPGPGGVAPGFSYDNLFYPAGSPQTATDYPFSGGFLDIYGLVFNTSSGLSVNFWSNGDMGKGVFYGAGVTDGVNVLDYVGGIRATSAIPESATWAMMILGFGMTGALLRRQRMPANRTKLV